MVSFINYDELKSFIGNTTGKIEYLDEFKLKEIQFDKYLIKIRLTLDDRFVDIESVGLNKDFLSVKQKCSKRGFHDVEELYKD